MSICLKAKQYEPIPGSSKLQRDEKNRKKLKRKQQLNRAE
jgi:hypothetical protein